MDRLDTVSCCSTAAAQPVSDNITAVYYTWIRRLSLEKASDISVQKCFHGARVCTASSKTRPDPLFTAVSPCQGVANFLRKIFRARSEKYLDRVR